MKISEIRKLSAEELSKKIQQEKKLLVETKDAMNYGKEKDVKKALKIRKNIARMLTVLSELNLDKQ